MDSGVVQQQTRMGSDWFGEGIARYGDKLYQITWLTNRGFIYSIPDLKQVRPCCLCELVLLHPVSCRQGVVRHSHTIALGCGNSCHC